MSEHFVNFAPADAVQYDGTVGAWLAASNLLPNEYEMSALGDGGYAGGLLIERDSTRDDWALRIGQWLVRQGDRVWVQDEEPAKVDRWEWSWGWATDDMPALMAGVYGERKYVDAAEAERIAPTITLRRPVLSNGWTGPWMPAEGGAE